MSSQRVLHVASEHAPLTGHTELARESLFLAQGLARLGVDLTVTLPGDRVADLPSSGLARRLDPLDITAPGGTAPVTVWEGVIPGGRARLLAFELPASVPVADRHALYCHAVVEVVGRRGLWPDLVRADLATAPVLAEIYARSSGPDGDRPAPATVLALSAPDEDHVRAALVGASGTARGRARTQAGEEGGAPHANRVVVPSRALAASLRGTDPEAPAAPALASVVVGIVPGIDHLAWNPRHEGLPAAGDEAMMAKAGAKRELQRALDLPTRSWLPLVAVPGPVDSDLLTGQVLSALDALDLQLVFVLDGDADRDLAAQLSAQAARVAPAARRFAVVRRTGDALHAEHARALAAADFALLAHRPPTSGMCDLHCLHYGALPIAPRAGIYADILVDVDIRTATGSGMLFDLDGGVPIARAALRAVRLHQDRPRLESVASRVMGMDLSWRGVAQRYAELYAALLREHAGHRAAS